MLSLSISEQRRRALSAQIWGSVELDISWEAVGAEVSRIGAVHGINPETIDTGYLEDMLPTFFAHIPHVTRAVVSVRLEPVATFEQPRLLRMCAFEPARNRFVLLAPLGVQVMAHIAIELAPFGVLTKVRSHLNLAMRRVLEQFPPGEKRTPHRQAEVARRAERAEAINKLLSQLPADAPNQDRLLVALFASCRSRRKGAIAYTSKQVSISLLTKAIGQPLGSEKELEAHFESLRAQGLLIVCKTKQHGMSESYRLTHKGEAQVARYVAGT